MAVTNRSDVDGEGAPPAARLAARLSASRWRIVGAAAVVLAFHLAGTIAAAPAAVLFLALAGLLVLLTEPARPPGPAAAVAPHAAIGSEAGVELVADALPDPCFILDRRGVVRHANQRAVAAFGARPGEPLTLKLRAPDVIDALDRVARGGPPERVEFVERVPTERWYAAWFAPLDPDGGDDGAIILIIDDLTERRRSDRIRVDFVANASHELRTPLASLVGFIETLEGPAREDPAARQRFLKIMHEQATRMSRLIDDLLSLSRIEMKAHMRPSDPVDLAPVVSAIVDALEPLARELGVAIETTAPQAPVVVAGDRDELTRVFENLIENACKYGQSGKRVVVSVAATGPDGGPTVTVRDFGPGIPEEHIPRLTERFYRVDVEESRRHRGTGLGLAIVKHILARHRARLVIESTAGEGASFTVSFPQATVMAGPPSEQKAQVGSVA
jgi:two-component system phosphate regulon sensor histidine kinase PhoR